MKDCNHCRYISLTEIEQNTFPKQPSHICLKYDERVFHFSEHPRLIPVRECSGKDFVLKEE